MINCIKFLNKYQRNKVRKLKLKFYDRKEKNKCKEINSIDRVLIVCTNEGWGDSLYVSGLARRLKLEGAKKILLSAPKHICNHFYSNIYDYIFPLEHDEQEVAALKPNLIVDLTYIGNTYYKERLRLINACKVPSLTVSELCSDLFSYTDYISYEKESHISKRLALVLAHLTGKNEDPILPYCEFSQFDHGFISDFLQRNLKNAKKVAYVNAIARDDDRCLNDEQLVAIIINLLDFGYDGVVYNTKNTIKFLDNRVVSLPQVAFSQLVALIHQTSLVITPDTSVTHISSCFDIPTFVIFPGNDRDFWAEYRASDVWGALSSKHYNFFLDDKELKIDYFGYKNKKTTPVSKYPINQIISSLTMFLINLYEKRY